jgi:hypothetical protein
MRKLLSLALVLALITPVIAANRGPSTQPERARLLKAADLMQKKPLTPEARKEGVWALQFITDVPDINVTICGSFDPGYKYEPQLMAAHIISMGAFIIKNPKKAADQNAVWRAGVEGMLTSYESIIQKDRAASDDFYDDLVQQQSEDNLVSFMHEFGLHCYAGSGSRSTT